MWLYYALGASTFWGITYVLNEQAYKKISVLTSLALASLVVFVITTILSLSSGNFVEDVKQIASSRQLLGYVLGGIASLLIAELFIGYSITAKSATLAGLIEISYPIFIALFSYLFFKSKVSLPTLVGAAVVFTGIFIIYRFNK
jgi:drug/metabolite transporter (DMT)-like permease